MKDRDTPLRLVRLWEKKIPGVYDTLDGLKAINGSAGIRWPDFCDLPISAAFVILLCCGLPCDIVGRIAAELTACYTWRKTKVIYSFNEDLSYMLAAQADDFMYTDILPADVLVHPPYPCTFVKTDLVSFCLIGRPPYATTPAASEGCLFASVGGDGPQSQENTSRSWSGTACAWNYSGFCCLSLLLSSVMEITAKLPIKSGEGD